MINDVSVGKVYSSKLTKQLYQVIFVGRHTEKPMEWMVGYMALYDTEEQFQVMPYSLFLMRFDRPDYIETVERFHKN